jgi:L-fucose isomerase-like protein
MKVVPTRVVLLHCGDEQYPQDELKRVSDSVEKGLRALPSAELVCTCTIMKDSDADAAAKTVAAQSFDAIVVHFVSWHITPYVMRTLKDYRTVPLLVWGTGGWRDAGGKIISPAAAAGTTALVPLLQEMGYTYSLINERVDEPHRFRDAERFLRAVGAAKAVRHLRIGLYGYADMGLYTCSYSRTLALEKLGVDIEDYFAYELADQMKAFSPEEVAGEVAEIRRTTVQTNPISDEVLGRIARLYLAMKGKQDSRGLDAVSIKCVNGVTKQMGFNPCLAQTLLASKDTTVICECDAYGLLTGQLMSKLTGLASAFVENYEVCGDAMLVGVCGFIPRDFADGDVRIRSANLGAYNTGVSNVSRMKTGVVTYGRLFESHGEYKLFLARGTTKPNPKWTEIGWCEPTPDFPSVLLDPGMPVEEYLQKVPGQHIVMIPGDWVQDLELLCKLLKIEVVNN